MRAVARITAMACLLSATAAAQTTPPAATAPTSSTVTLPPVDVIASSPLLGSGIDRTTVPAETNVLRSSDLTRSATTPPNAVRALAETVGSVNLDSASGNPFQPTLLYHGYQASALQGTTQGLAVYVDGVRFNQAFGDTVNFDLLPEAAIYEINLEGSNPVFGLNALGGALSIRLKNGFTWQGLEASASGGSFGTLRGDFQYGQQSGSNAIYVAATGLHQGGWRDLQSSDMQSFYGDVGWRGHDGELHVNALLAHSALNGPGTAPVELLAADPAAQFTAPNLVTNQFMQLGANGTIRVNETLSLQAVAYYNNFLQRVANGNAPNDTPCNDGSALLCNDRGFSTTRGGTLIPAFLGSDPLAYSELDRQTTNTNDYGIALQATETSDLLGFHNHLVVGASFDGAQTMFTGVSAIGGIDLASRVFIVPAVILDEPGSNQPTRVAVADRYAGLFLTDTINLTDRLAVTASGRFNAAAIDLNDRNGVALSGSHTYQRFNPALGATFRVTSWLTAYAGYAEANRAPTPAELSCASPGAPCSLANFFVGDPNLKQVVARTVELGVRGSTRIGEQGRLNYELALYRSGLQDDIAFINSATLNRAYFANVGQTRRQGVDASVRYRRPRWSAYLAYSYTEATYRSGFTEAAGSNPAADDDGSITIRPGDRLPGVPLHQVKLGLTWRVTEQWTVSAVAIAQSGAYLFGDEANLTPRLPGFVTLNLSTAYDIAPHVTLFAAIDNATDARYYTYGTFSPTRAVFLAQARNATNPRSYSPAAPIGAFGGVRITF